MEDNPELERAERELEMELYEERLRKNLARKKSYISDYLIALSAIVHLIFAIASPFLLILILIAMIVGERISWLLFFMILLYGTVSLGTAMGLFRILDLSKTQIEIRKDEE